MTSNKKSSIIIRTQNWWWVVSRIVVSLVLIGFISCSSRSCGSSGTTSQSADATPASLIREWKTIKPEAIAIPANSGGEAMLTRNFYFILDGSGSMREPTSQQCGGDQSFPDKITGAKWAINKFLEQVPADVNIGLFIFDNYDKREVVPLGPANREAFFKAVGNIDPGGGTPLAMAIRYGTDRLVDQYKKQLGYGEYRLIVITDGQADEIPEAAIYAAKFGIPIYAIGLCVEANHPLRDFSVSYQAADSFTDLSRGLQDTLAELPNYDVTQFQNN